MFFGVFDRRIEFSEIFYSFPENILSSPTEGGGWQWSDCRGGRPGGGLVVVRQWRAVAGGGPAATNDGPTVFSDDSVAEWVVSGGGW